MNQSKKDSAIIILAGGEGSRLRPLTEIRCKPAVIFGGRYRLIDISLSNAMNSGFTDIYVLSQFLANTLNNYLLRTYHSHHFRHVHIHTLSPKPDRFGKTEYFDGTGDAVRKNLNTLLKHPAKYFIILSGDQVYSMDLSHMLQFAKKTQADITIAAIPVNETKAKEMGVLLVDKNHKIVNFIEKPSDPTSLSHFDIQHLFSSQNKKKTNSPMFLGSMGIYIFTRKTLVNLLTHHTGKDFGKHLIPHQLKYGNVFAYVFNGYWEDVGTIPSYYHATLNLSKNQSLNLYDETRPFYGQTTSLPPAKIIDTKITDTTICEGTIIQASSIQNSMIGFKTYIEKDSKIVNSILLGNPFSKHKNSIYIGKNCHLENVIIDEKVYIQDDVHLSNVSNIEMYDSKEVFIRNGIVIVKAGSIILKSFCLKNVI